MRASSHNSSFDLRHSLMLVTIAGCLAMVYSTTISSPATIEFFRMLGANEFQFGLLGGIPLIMLFVQFIGALITSRIKTRKWLFIVMTMVGRSLYVAVAFLPLAFPAVSGHAVIAALLMLVALSQGMTNLIVPVWYSWMGDLIPQVILNRYWGSRYRWMQVTWMLAYLAVAALTYFVHLPIKIIFPIMVTIGCAAGLMDILLFVWVPEPPNPAIPERDFINVLLEPLRHVEYRRFVIFSCVWSAATMFSASFMQLYVLKVLKIGVWQATLIWAACAPGAVLTARAFGEAADKFGQTPVLRVCLAFKPLIVVVFLLLTAESAAWLLPIAFFFDSILNTGTQIASDGYMLKIGPRENRSMFVVAITGLAGICSGLATLAGGAFLLFMSEFSFDAFGRTWNNYHLMFAVNVFMRVACLPLLLRIREPGSASAGQVIDHLKSKMPWRDEPERDA